jgi:hypothetical protein
MLSWPVFIFYLGNDGVQKLLGVVNCLKNKRDAVFKTETKRIAPHQILPPEPQKFIILMDLV